MNVRPVENRKNLLPVAAAALGNAIWGVAYLFTAVAFRYASPEVMLSIRFIIAFLIMNLMLLSGKEKLNFKGKDLKYLLVFAVLEPVYFYFESYAIMYTNSSFAGTVLSIVPVISIMPGMVFLKEFLTGKMLLFSLLLVAGAFIMSVDGSSLGIVQPIGIALLLCTCLTSAAYKIVNRKTSRQFSSFERTYMVLLVSMIVFTFAALRSVHWGLQVYLAPMKEPLFVGSILALCILSSVCANMMVNYAAGHLPVAELSAFGALSTLCSMAAGVLILKEPVTPAILSGMVLILVGIQLVTRNSEAGGVPEKDASSDEAGHEAASLSAAER